MKLLQVLSCAALAALLLASAEATASRLQNQAIQEQELSAALLAGNGVIVIGAADDVDLILRTRTTFPRTFFIQDGIGDPVIVNSFHNRSGNPARDGFRNNPARGGFMLNAPVRR